MSKTRYNQNKNPNGLFHFIELNFDSLKQEGFQCEFQKKQNDSRAYYMVHASDFVDNDIVNAYLSEANASLQLETTQVLTPHAAHLSIDRDTSDYESKDANLAAYFCTHSHVTCEFMCDHKKIRAHFYYNRHGDKAIYQNNTEERCVEGFEWPEDFSLSLEKRNVLEAAMRNVSHQIRSELLLPLIQRKAKYYLALQNNYKQQEAKCIESGKQFYVSRHTDQLAASAAIDAVTECIHIVKKKGLVSGEGLQEALHQQHLEQYLDFLNTKLATIISEQKVTCDVISEDAVLKPSTLKTSPTRRKKKRLSQSKKAPMPTPGSDALTGEELEVIEQWMLQEGQAQTTFEEADQTRFIKNMMAALQKHTAETPQPEHILQDVYQSIKSQYQVFFEYLKSLIDQAVAGDSNIDLNEIYVLYPVLVGMDDTKFTELYKDFVLKCLRLEADDSEMKIMATERNSETQWYISPNKLSSKPFSEDVYVAIGNCFYRQSEDYRSRVVLLNEEMGFSVKEIGSKINEILDSRYSLMAMLVRLTLPKIFAMFIRHGVRLDSEVCHSISQGQETSLCGYVMYIALQDETKRCFVEVLDHYNALTVNEEEPSFSFEDMMECQRDQRFAYKKLTGIRDVWSQMIWLLAYAENDASDIKVFTSKLNLLKHFLDRSSVVTMMLQLPFLSIRYDLLIGVQHDVQFFRSDSHMVRDCHHLAVEQSSQTSKNHANVSDSLSGFMRIFVHLPALISVISTFAASYILYRLYESTYTSTMLDSDEYDATSLIDAYREFGAGDAAFASFMCEDDESLKAEKQKRIISLIQDHVFPKFAQLTLGERREIIFRMIWQAKKQASALIFANPVDPMLSYQEKAQQARLGNHYVTTMILLTMMLMSRFQQQEAVAMDQLQAAYLLFLWAKLDYDYAIFMENLGADRFENHGQKIKCLLVQSDALLQALAPKPDALSYEGRWYHEIHCKLKLLFARLFLVAIKKPEHDEYIQCIENLYDSRAYIPVEDYRHAYDSQFNRLQAARAADRHLVANHPLLGFWQLLSDAMEHHMQPPTVSGLSQGSTAHAGLFMMQRRGQGSTKVAVMSP